MIEISSVQPFRNIYIENPNPTFFLPGVILGDRYATVIRPEYIDIYKSAGSLILHGCIDTTITNPKHNVPKRIIDGFGISSTNIKLGDDSTVIILPLGTPSLMTTLDKYDTQDHIHAFHQGLITKANNALELLHSEYRFAAVPEI